MKQLHLPVRLPLLLVLLIAASCGSSQPDPSAAAAEFNSRVGRDISFDYEPLGGPAAALEAADLIVVGEVVGVSEGMMIVAPGPGAPAVRELTEEEEQLPEIDQPDFSDPGETVLGSYVTIEVLVIEIIGGDGASVGDTLQIQLDRSPTTRIDELVAVPPIGLAVFILSDLTDWSPRPDAVFIYPSNFNGEQVLAPYTDGVWFTTADGAAGPFASTEDLGGDWGNPETVEDIADALRNAGD